MLTPLLSALTLGSALLNIRAEYRSLRRQVYVFKPLTTSLILLIALQGGEIGTPFYRHAIAGGLLCSLAGDVLLMLPEDRFVAGLGSFLMGHLCYIAAFSCEVSLASGIGALLPLLAYVALMSRILWPHLGKMRMPVLAYELVIVAMAWRALARWTSTQEVGALPALVGAILFVVSDSALAIDRFVGRYRGAQALILSTYYCAQWLIAMSV